MPGCIAVNRRSTRTPATAGVSLKMTTRARHGRPSSQTGAKLHIFDNAEQACQAAAERIAETLVKAVEQRGKAVLGLATGSTPIAVYRHLIRLHRENDLSFRDVSTYNLDEYYPIAPNDANSYRAYMQRHLFDHIDLAPNRAHVLDGTVPEAFANAHAAEFQRWLESEGGLDLQLLGIGRNGHIGFNEPTELPLDKALHLPTRLVDLHPVTITDAARDFGGESHVIRRALTLGTGPILEAREILLVALGGNKAEAVAQALNGPITPRLPASLLQTVADRVTWFLDPAAASALG